MNFQQTIWLVRHGSRFDFIKPQWFSNSTKPYDPPLAHNGYIQAKKLAERLKTENIQHIFSCSYHSRTP